MNYCNFAKDITYKMKYAHYLIAILLLFPFSMVHASKDGNAMSLSEIGRKYYYSEDYPHALQYFVGGMKAAEAEDDSHCYMVCVGYLSNIYNNFGDFQGCLYYAKRGYDMALKTNNVIMQNRFLSNLVFFYCCVGDIENARKSYDGLRKTPGDDKVGWNYFILYGKARLSKYSGKLNDALREFSDALNYAKAHKMHDIYKLFQLSEIGNVYLDLHQYPEAILMGQKCLSLSKRLKNNDLQINACKMLADAYSRIGDRDSSDKYRMQYYVLNDKIYNLKKYFSLKNSLLQYENMQVDRHINHLELTIIFVSLIVLSLVILVVVIIKKNRSLRDAQKMLIRKNNELQKSESKSNELMKKYIPDAVIPDHNEQKEVQPGENTPILNEEQSEHLLRLIISAMENNDAVFNPDFNLNTLAVMVNSNTKYVSMVINDTYQKNFKTLLNEYRIREACKRLTDTEHYGNMTIQAIYEEVGYRNAVNFIRVFKKVMGMTPSVYQRLSQEKDEDR